MNERAFIVVDIVGMCITEGSDFIPGHIQKTAFRRFSRQRQKQRIRFRPVY